MMQLQEKLFEIQILHGASQSRGSRDLRRAASSSTLNWVAQAFTTFHAADSAALMSPSFEVTATTMFLPGMNTASAYHIVFDPLCQYTVYGISLVGCFTTQPHA